MAESVGTLTADLSLGGISKFQAGLKKAGSGFNKLGTAAKIAGGLIAGAIAIKAVRALGEAVTAAVEFEKAIAEVGTLTNATAKETAVFADNVRNLSVQFGAPAVETAAALYQTISAGFSSAADSSKVMTAALKLGIGGVTDTTTAVDGLTTILSSYGISADGSTEVSDKLFVAMRAGKTTVGELSSSMGAVTSIAAALGVSLDETLSATSALTTGGKRTKVAVTELRQVFVNILKPTAQAAELSKSLGIEFNAAALKSKGLAAFLEDVRVKTGGSTEALSLLFGSVEAVGAVLGLTGPQAQTFSAILEDMDKAAGSTEEAVATMADTTAFKIKKSQAAWARLSEEIGAKFLPTLDKFVAGWTQAIRLLDDPTPAQAAKKLEDAQAALLKQALRTNRGFRLSVKELKALKNAEDEARVKGEEFVKSFVGGVVEVSGELTTFRNKFVSVTGAIDGLTGEMRKVGKEGEAAAKKAGDAVRKLLNKEAGEAKKRVKELKEELVGIQAVIAKGGFAADFGAATRRQQVEIFGGGPGGVVAAPPTGPTGVEAMVARGGFAEPAGFREAQERIAIFGGGVGTLAEETKTAGEIMGDTGKVIALLGAEASGVSAALATGDLLGAAIALVASTGALDPVLNAVSDVFAQAVAPFEGLLGGVASLVEAMGPLITVTTDVLKPAFDALGKAFTFIGKAIIGAMIFILKIVDKIPGINLSKRIRKLEKQRSELGKTKEEKEEAEEEKVRFIDRENALTSAKFSRSLEGAQLRDAVRFAAELSEAGKLSEKSALDLADALEEAGAGAAAQALEELGSAGAARALELAMKPAARAALASAERAAKLEESNKKLEKSTNNLKDATDKVAGSFSQLPSGFKIASDAFAAGTAFTRREALGGVADPLQDLRDRQRAEEESLRGRRSAAAQGPRTLTEAGAAVDRTGRAAPAVTVNIGVQNNQIRDVPDFLRQLDEEGSRRSLVQGGVAMRTPSGGRI